MENNTSPDRNQFEMADISAGSRIEWKGTLNERTAKMDAQISLEKRYIKITEDIIGISRSQLHNQSQDKKQFRRFFAVTIVVWLSIQLVVLIFLLGVIAFCEDTGLTEPIVNMYVTSVFLETFAGIIYMIVYAFNSKDEVHTIEILNNIIKNFQKPKL